MTSIQAAEVLAQQRGLIPENARLSIAVAGKTMEHHMVATRPIRCGEVILRVTGERTPIASRYSVQIGRGTHLNPQASSIYLGPKDPYIWRYMNHSCDPNTYFRDLEVVAIREILPGEDVTFDYNATEYDMAEPFECHCRSIQCRRRIRGFRYLSAAAREEIRPYAALYLWEYPDPAGEFVTAVASA